MNRNAFGTIMIIGTSKWTLSHLLQIITLLILLALLLPWESLSASEASAYSRLLPEASGLSYDTPTQLPFIPSIKKEWWKEKPNLSWLEAEVRGKRSLRGSRKANRNTGTSLSLMLTFGFRQHGAIMNGLRRGAGYPWVEQALIY